MKQDVLAEFALVLARLLGRNGNRVGAILYDTGTTRIVPPGTGRSHALRIGRELDRGPDSRAAATTDLAAMLDTVASLARRCLVVVISDFIGTGSGNARSSGSRIGTRSSRCGSSTARTTPYPRPA